MKQALLERYPKLDVCMPSADRALSALTFMARAGGTLLLAGNGGSAADCDHIAGELLKGFMKKRPDPTLPDWASGLQRGIRAVSLPGQTAALTAFSNDVNPDMAYAQLVFAYARPGDVCMALSTSGNSRNIVNALRIARHLRLTTILLTGEAACAADEFSDIAVHVPETETYLVQEYHLPLYHYLCARLEQEIFCG